MDTRDDHEAPRGPMDDTNRPKISKRCVLFVRMAVTYGFYLSTRVEGMPLLFQISIV